MSTDAPRERLIALIENYGPDVLDMSETVASELHLHCTDHRAEVDGLIAALRHGVVHYLLVLAKSKKLESANLPGQVSRLCYEAGMDEGSAQRAVNTWAELIGAMRISPDDKSPWRREPRELHRRRFAGLNDVLLVGIVAMVASMLPWLAVVEEKRGHNYLIPDRLEPLGVHAMLNLLGAVGGFAGGAVGWVLGSLRSLEFQVRGGSPSRQRLFAGCLAAGLGSFFGLWLAYHHIRDIGAFAGPFMGAGVGRFRKHVNVPVRTDRGLMNCDVRFGQPAPGTRRSLTRRSPSW